MIHDPSLIGSSSSCLIPAQDNGHQFVALVATPATKTDSLLPVISHLDF